MDAMHAAPTAVCHPYADQQYAQLQDIDEEGREASDDNNYSDDDGSDIDGYDSHAAHEHARAPHLYRGY